LDGQSFLYLRPLLDRQFPTARREVVRFAATAEMALANIVLVNRQRL